MVSTCLVIIYNTVILSTMAGGAIAIKFDDKKFKSTVALSLRWFHHYAAAL